MTLRIWFPALALAVLAAQGSSLAQTAPAAPEPVRTPCDTLRLAAGDPVPADAKRAVFSQNVLIVRNPRGCAGLAASAGVLLTPMRYSSFGDAVSGSGEALVPLRDGKPPQRALVRARLMPWPLTAGDIARGVSSSSRDSDALDLYAVDFKAAAATLLDVRGWSHAQNVSPFPDQSDLPLARILFWSVTGPGAPAQLVAWPTDRAAPEVFAGASLRIVASVGPAEVSPDDQPGARTWYLVLERTGPQGSARQDIYDSALRPIAKDLLAISVPTFHSPSATLQHGVLMVLYTADGQCRFIDRRGLRPWSVPASAKPGADMEACAVVSLTNFAVFAPSLHNRFRRPAAAVLVDGLAVRAPELPPGLDAAQVQQGVISDPKRTDWVVWRSEPDPASPDRRPRRLWALADFTVSDDQAALRAPIGPWYRQFSGQDCRKRCAAQRIEDGKWQLIEQGREIPGAISEKLPEDLQQRVRVSL